MNENTNLKILAEKDLTDKICVVVGTRPSIIMFSPIIRELERQKLNYFVIHTGQHYSYNMDRKFFEDLELKEPEYKLDTVKNCHFHGEQTAEMLKGTEKILIKEKPKVVLVGGDANTNLAGGLAARKLHIKLGHVEAGERSGDWRMPEEHNRIMLDHISEYLFVTNEKSKKNLVADNVKGEIFITGNPIVDAAYQNLNLAQQKSKALKDYSLDSQSYFLLTLHREENVDNKENLANVIEGMRLVYNRFGRKIIFFAHPRSQRRMREFGLEKAATAIKGLEIKDAVGYIDFLFLLKQSLLVLTDSGGVQQESCILRVPCVTLRENTEWTETLDMGANMLSGVLPQRISDCVSSMLESNRTWTNPFGDGKTAVKIIRIIKKDLQKKGDLKCTQN
jgi:UDP-N-acetylglucosamine 2-epimerase (non-hydrolysing)